MSDDAPTLPERSTDALRTMHRNATRMATFLPTPELLETIDRIAAELRARGVTP